MKEKVFSSGPSKWSHRPKQSPSMSWHGACKDGFTGSSQMLPCLVRENLQLIIWMSGGSILRLPGSFLGNLPMRGLNTLRTADDHFASTVGSMAVCHPGEILL